MMRKSRLGGREDEKFSRPLFGPERLHRLHARSAAALWDRWKDRTNGSVLETYTIITTDPNELVQPMHDRMPVILSPSDYDRWLDPGDPDQPPVDLLRPIPAERMTAWKVSPAVGNTKNDSPELRLPIQRQEEPGDLFSNVDASPVE